MTAATTATVAVRCGLIPYYCAVTWLHDWTRIDASFFFFFFFFFFFHPGVGLFFSPLPACLSAADVGRSRPAIPRTNYRVIVSVLGPDVAWQDLKVGCLLFLIHCVLLFLSPPFEVPEGEPRR